MLAEVEKEMAAAAPEARSEELLRRQVVAMERVAALQEASVSEAAAAAAYPQQPTAVYEAVLKRWRLTAFDAMVRESEFGLRSKATDRDRDSAVREMHECKRQLEVQKHKAANLEAAVVLERRRGDHAEAEVALFKKAALEAAEALRKQGAYSAELAELLNERQQSFNGDVMMPAALAKQEEQSTRLGLMVGRLESLKTLLAQREVRLRNETAALAAEKRLWRREREAQEIAALKETSNNKEGIVVYEEDIYATTVLLEGLRPEAEAAMRGVFCEVDVDQRGMARKTDLRAALRRDVRLGRLMRHWIGEDTWLESLEALDALLPDDDGEDEDVTWGEFLLLFVKQPLVFNGSKMKLPTSSSWHSDESRLVLTLPKEDSSEDSKHFERLGLGTLRRETARLTAERSALMRALQAANSDGRRVREEAGLEWRHELAALRRRAARSEAEKNESLKNVTELEARASDAEQRAVALRSQAVEEARAFQTQVERAALTHESEQNRLREAAKREATSFADRETALERELREALGEREAAIQLSRRLERDAKRASEASEEAVERAAVEQRRTAAIAQAELEATRRERNELLAALRSSSPPKKKKQPNNPAPRREVDARLENLKSLTNDLLKDIVLDDDDEDDEDQQAN